MVISKNSYLVLGLNSDSDEKFLNKRYKELLNFLNIDEVGLYENDLSFLDYKEIRTEENIKEAFHNLSNQYKKLYQTFFRFQLVDDKDEKCMSDIVAGKYFEGLNKWLELFEKTNKFHYLKNHIILGLLLYENKFKDLSFTELPTTIADLLHKLIYSESFWKEFKEIFNVQSEIAVRDDMIEDFKNQIPQYIAEYFFDISEEIGDSKLYIEFSNRFGISAKELDDNKNVTDSIKNIEDTLKSIREMSLSDELDEIIDGINEITVVIKKLNKLGLKNNPKIIRLKDEFSSEIRSMAIELFNEYDDSDNAINFIEEAIQVAHSNNLKEKFKQDLININEQGQKTELFRKVIDLSKLGENQFDSKNYIAAQSNYESVKNIIIEEFSGIFNLDVSKLNGLIGKIDAQFSLVPLGRITLESVIDNIDNMKKLVNEDGGFSWGEDLQFSGLGGEQKLLLILFIDSIVYGKLSQLIIKKKNFSAPTMRTINGCGTKIYGDTLYFTLIYIPIFPVSRYHVDDLGGGQYQFHDQYKLHKRQKIWFWIVIIGFAFWLFILYGENA